MNWIKSILKIAVLPCFATLAVMLSTLDNDIKQITIYSFLFYFVLSFTIFYIFNARPNSNPHLFVNKMLISIMLKLFCSVAFVLAFKFLYKPTNNMFVFPFLAMYLYFMFFTTKHIAKFVKN
jgi:hypothetical protein